MKIARTSLTLLAVFSAAACGGDGGTTPPPPTPAIALGLSAATGSVQAGGSGTVTATVTRTNFTGAVSVAASGAPAGVTPSVTNTGDAFTVALAVATTTAPGSYPLTIAASGTGVSSASATYTLTVTPRPAIALALSPTSASVAQGASTTFTATVTPTNFAGATSVAITGAPTGVTPTVTTAGNVHSVAVAVAASVVPGAYTLTATASGTGVTSVTATFALTVTPVATQGSITLSFSRNPAAIAQGASGSNSLIITRTNFTGQVNLSVTSGTVGVTPTLGSTATLGNGETLSIAVAANVPIGNHTVTVTASGSGITTAQASFTVNVTQASAGISVTFSFCGASNQVPLWVAVQNANGAWTQVVAGANNTYTFTISTAGGVAWVTQDGTNDYDLNIYYGNSAELTTRGTSYCLSPTLKSVTGTATGFAATDLVLVTLGGAAASPNIAAPNFTLTGVPDGLVDLVATRTPFSLANPLSQIPSKIFMRRGLNPANSSNIGTVDFNHATDAFDPDSKQLTIVGGQAGETISSSAIFITANRGTASLGGSSGGGTLNYAAVPSSRTVAGDLHAVGAAAFTIANNLPVTYRTITSIFRDATNTQLTLGSLLGTPTISTAATAPYARLRAQLTRQGEYNNLWTAGFTQATSNRSVTISMTEGYIAGAGAFDVTIPDFTPVAGWQNTWGPSAGVSTIWSVSAFGWVVGNGTNAEGSISRTALRQGTVTP